MVTATGYGHVSCVMSKFGRWWGEDGTNPFLFMLWRGDSRAICLSEAGWRTEFGTHVHALVHSSTVLSKFWKCLPSWWKPIYSQCVMFDELHYVWVGIALFGFVAMAECGLQEDCVVVWLVIFTSTVWPLTNALLMAQAVVSYPCYAIPSSFLLCYVCLYACACIGIHYVLRVWPPNGRDLRINTPS